MTQALNLFQDQALLARYGSVYNFQFVFNISLPQSDKPNKSLGSWIRNFLGTIKKNLLFFPPGFRSEWLTLKEIHIVH